MNLFYQPAIQQGVLYLDADESKHCAKVLRKKIGDTILVTDGKGFIYEVELLKASIEECSFTIVNTLPEKARGSTIHIAIAPTKNPDRIEWFVEKATELGIDAISLMVCKNSERSHLKPERLHKIAIMAMKQSQRARLPIISAIKPFHEIVREPATTSNFIAYVDQTNPDHLLHLAKKGTSYTVLIGPEGDFTQDELKLAQENGFVKVSLGNYRLRTETAGLAACHILNLINS